MSPLGKKTIERIGNTPLLCFQRVTRELPGTVLAKAEWANPGGSVKDRAALNIVTEALRTGELGSGKALLDSTSGNTGIAYAMLGAVYGFPVTLFMPANVSPERKHILKAYGAEVIFTDPLEGHDEAMRQAQELAEAEPERYFYADQYSNNANWQAHYYGAANEIWRQTDGRITHFAAMLGTSGTFVGTSRRLKELNPKIRCISMHPDGPLHGIEGTKHMLSTKVPKIYDPTIADSTLDIATGDAYAMVKRLAKEEGLLVGISAAAALAGCLQLARDAGPDSVIVTVFPDAADKYLSQKFWEET